MKCPASAPDPNWMTALWESFLAVEEAVSS